MTEQEIAVILNGWLLKNDSKELALMLAYESVQTGILGELLLNVDIDEEAKKKLKMLIGLKIRMCLMGVPEEELGEEGSPIPGGSIESFLEIYAKTNQVIDFLINNHDKMNWGSLPQQVTKQTLENLRQTMTLRKRAYEESAVSSSQFIVDSADAGFLRIIVDMACRAIMGHEIYKRFISEVNRTNSILQQLQIQLMPVSAQTKTMKN